MLSPIKEKIKNIFRGSMFNRKYLEFTAVGYPKTGNTWTRLMLGHYVSLVYSINNIPLFDSLEPENFSDTASKVPHGIFTHIPLLWENQTASDLCYDNVIRPYENKKVIFLTRHPLDVMVSLFMHESVRLAHLGRYTGTLPEFILDPIFGLEKLIKFHKLWAKYNNITSSFLLWRYEDVIQKPAACFKKLLEFIGLPVDESFITESINFASFSNMKKMESSGHSLVYKSSGFRFLARVSSDNPNAFHVRKGKVGGYNDEIEPCLARQLENQVRKELPELFGY
jgi:hypothetical protein